MTGPLSRAALKHVVLLLALIVVLAGCAPSIWPRCAIVVGPV